MEPRKKAAWKCSICLERQKLTSRVYTEDRRNITLRRKIISTATLSASSSSKPELPAYQNVSTTLDSYNATDEEFDESDHTDLDAHSRSEDYSTIKMCEIQDMKEEIKSLKTNLLCTQNELENSIIENNEQKTEINKLKKEIEILKGICRSPLTKNAKDMKKGFQVAPLRKFIDIHHCHLLHPSQHHLKIMEKKNKRTDQCPTK